MFNQDYLRTDFSEPLGRTLRKTLGMMVPYSARYLLFHAVRDENLRSVVFVFTLNVELLQQIKDGKQAYSITGLTIFRRPKGWRYAPISVRVSLDKRDTKGG